MGFGVAFFCHQENSPAEVVEEAEGLASEGAGSKEDVTTQIFQKCFYVDRPSEEVVETLRHHKIEAGDLEAESLETIGARVEAFLKSWDTEGFSPFEIAQEGQLFKWFLREVREASFSFTEMMFFRQDPKKIYQIKIIGPDIQKTFGAFKATFASKLDGLEEKKEGEEGFEVFESELTEQKAECEKNRLGFKDLVVIRPQTISSTTEDESKMKPLMILNVNKPWSDFYRENAQDLRFSLINPLQIEYFALAPTITRAMFHLKHGNKVSTQLFCDLEDLC